MLDVVWLLGAAWTGGSLPAWIGIMAIVYGLVRIALGAAHHERPKVLLARYVPFLAVGAVMLFV